MAKRRKNDKRISTEYFELPDLGAVVAVEIYESGRAQLMHLAGPGHIRPADRERVAAWLCQFVAGGHEGCYAMLWDDEPPYSGGE